MSGVRLLQSCDIAAAMELSREAGWNQTESDWRRILDLEPEGCFALDREGVLAGTTTAVCYGKEMAWIGMVLTRSEFRRRGFARQLMERALAFSRERGVTIVRLDATPMGRPLYASLGFEEECPIERWRRSGDNVDSRDGPAVTAYQPMPGLDREAFGCDRSRLLESLAQIEAASIPGLGYAMGRPGARAAYFGPCVAGTPETARMLLEWFLERHRGESICWDLLPENHAAVALATEFGFVRDRSLIRMIRRERPHAASSGVNSALTYAIAGFEYG